MRGHFTALPLPLLLPLLLLQMLLQMRNSLSTFCCCRRA